MSPAVSGRPTAGVGAVVAVAAAVGLGTHTLGPVDAMHQVLSDAAVTPWPLTNPVQPLVGGLVSPRPDSTVVDRQSGSALSANAAAWADHVVFVVDGRVHDVMDRPSADSVLDVVKGLGR